MYTNILSNLIQTYKCVIEQCYNQKMTLCECYTTQTVLSNIKFELLQDLVAQLNVETLQRLAFELLRRQPAAFADLVNGAFLQGEPPPDPDRPNHGSPDQCFCGNCAPMPTQEENKCCCRRVMPCITTNPLFTQLVLDGNVLDIAMSYREDVLVLNHPRNNENFWHAAYIWTVCAVATWSSGQG